MHDLIVFGEDFGGLPSSTQHIVKLLSHNRKVLWINSIGLRKPRLSKKDTLRVFKKLISRSGSKHTYSDTSDSRAENITVANIKTIPAPKYAWERSIAKRIMLHQLRPLIKRLKLEKPILWTSLPTASDLCGELNESGVVYYCGDDFGALAGVDHSTVLEHEHLLARHSNLILVASDAMRLRFPASKTLLVRHGVDYSLFSTPIERANDLPVGKPIVGFYGSLSEWLDLSFIQDVANAKPDWDFVFIGPQERPVPELAALNNVHLLGPRPHHQLPSYSQHWQMSWLPFKNNAQIKACSPLKLMEYIATGTPIAATQFDATKPYCHQINEVHSSDDMIALLDQPARWICPDRNSVKEDSWHQRAQFVDWLLELL
ncbi:glycosyltransferase family 1 protein [Vibrio alfacsensis]|uniref:Glycosyltransferase family 1 protein n=1 Tax=Vibrio alfacsensis TaxID=1074311 RepID=A0ABM6YTC9_9VIBR|nr:glycosyltransferase [Vibrio alfacsensis]AXY01105.1 glycosyltransferase family 1 protein [Vibrio alfacsensis]